MVRDRRRIDPETGRRRSATSNGDEAHVPESISGTLDDELARAAEQGGGQPEGAPTEQPAGEQSGLHQQVEELTADIKRVTAEYANFRKRVERDRESVIESAKASVAGELLTVLDDVERAEAHGDLTGAFKSVADKLIATLDSAGLKPFGAEGEEFDPAVHEAVQHDTSAEVSGPTVTTVLRRGYQFGDRVLRPAMVAVTDHAPEEPEGSDGADPTAQS
ncbi:nucleotide exchange factor GrpE [Saccharopolyspora sp. HNM0983]|uniref:Protein GrpE n=1 Tax=Saccharopolyspora montiporae TaxID=2781240 RepID=A0A929B9F9_9PSEU|nr:nucleotide exchange factor GrpE [Saccharopolyspora sp. HNM0983]